jgi:hypothetical protein
LRKSHGIAAARALQIGRLADTFAAMHLAKMVAGRLAGATVVAMVAQLTANIRENRQWDFARPARIGG